MFTRASFRNLRHKTKKGLMLKIGQTESQPEDPDFKHLLNTLDEAKKELKEIYNAARNVATSGKKFNENLEKFCGFGLRSEDVFSKDTEFLGTLEERVCTALGRIVNKDIKDLNEAVVQYKSAKLRFDAIHFKTVKAMRKEGKAVMVEHANEVMASNTELPALNEAYLDAKSKVRAQRDLIVSHLQTKVASRIDELCEISNAEHHQLYCKYFQERLQKTIDVCSEEPAAEEVAKLARSNTFSFYRNKPNPMLERKRTVDDPQHKDKNRAGDLRESFPGGNGVHDDLKNAELESPKHAKSLPDDGGASQQKPAETRQIQQIDSSSGVDVSKMQTVG